MVLQRLQLTNFRGFESLDLTFEPDLTVIVGVNGCGKTSIIDALLVGLGLQSPTAQDVRLGTTKTTVRVATSKQPQRFLSGELVADGSAVSVSSSGDLVPHELVLSYGARRGTMDATPGPTNPSVWKPDRARMKKFDSVSYDDFFLWFREMEDNENERIRYDGADAEEPSLKMVREATYRVLPGYSNLRIRRRGAMGDLRPRLTVEKNGELLLFDALSEGERTLIAMVADIARRLAIAYPDAINPLDEPCVLVIDELEQHLHPQWQRELPRRMREVFPGAQMVLTTHSPIVISELLPRQLRALQGFRLMEGTHREGQDVNEILEALFVTPSRRKETQALIDGIRTDLDEDELDQADAKLGELARQLGSDDPEVVRLTTIHRMLGAMDHDAVSKE